MLIPCAQHPTNDAKLTLNENLLAYELILLTNLITLLLLVLFHEDISFLSG